MNIKPHYTEADLLETYYTQPGESLPVMLHLADCAECAARYDRLDRKVRGLAACGQHDEKPETFWARQRMSVMRRVARAQNQQKQTPFTRIAAAALLVLALGGVMTWNRISGPEAHPAVAPAVKTAAAATAETVETRVSVTSTSDPWQSDELDEFGSMVEWESWVENGDQSL